MYRYVCIYKERKEEKEIATFDNISVESSRRSSFVTTAHLAGRHMGLVWEGAARDKVAAAVAPGAVRP